MFKLLFWIKQWAAERDAILALAQRTDRELADIGLLRGDIAQAVRTGVYSSPR